MADRHRGATTRLDLVDECIRRRLVGVIADADVGAGHESDSIRKAKLYGSLH